MIARRVGQAYMAWRAHTLALYLLALSISAFALAGFWLVRAHLGAPAAAAIIGGGLLMLALLLVWLSKPGSGSAAPDQAQGPSSEPASVMDTGMRLADTVRDQVERKPVESMLVAGVVGAVLGASPKTRKAMLDAVKSVAESQADT